MNSSVQTSYLLVLLAASKNSVITGDNLLSEWISIASTRSAVAMSFFLWMIAFWLVIVLVPVPVRVFIRTSAIFFKNDWLEKFRIFSTASPSPFLLLPLPLPLSPSLLLLASHKKAMQDADLALRVSLSTSSSSSSGPTHCTHVIIASTTFSLFKNLQANSGWCFIQSSTRFKKLSATFSSPLSMIAYSWLKCL